MSEEANFSGDNSQQEAAAPTSEAVNEVQAAENTQPQETVPLSALQAERTQRQQMAEELQMIKDHMALLDTQRREPQPQAKDPMDELPDDEIPTMGEIKKLFRDREKQYQSRLSEMQMAQKNPDYADVITKYLPDVIKENPSLKASLEKSQDYELAYYLAKKSDRYQTEHRKAKQNADAEKVVQNSQLAGSLSSMGTVSPINAAKRYREMTDDDFKKEVNKNLGYA